MAEDRRAPDPTRERQLEAALRRLLAVTRLFADEAGWDLAGCVVTVSARSDRGDRPLATVSLADCIAESERLVGSDDATGGLSDG
jgi:hypothetical protein